MRLINYIDNTITYLFIQHTYLNLTFFNEQGSDLNPDPDPNP